MYYGAKFIFVYIQMDEKPVTYMLKMDYKKLEEAIVDYTKIVVIFLKSGWGVG